jgi:hypothetical protein
MATYLKSYGMSERYVLEKDKNNKYRPKQSFNKMEWNGNYDGNKAHVDIQLNNNGHREHMNMVLNNNDLIEILNVPEVNIPIHQRLQNDFLLKNENEPLRQVTLENLLTKTRNYRNMNRYKRRYHRRSRKKNRSYKSTSNYRSLSSKSSKSKKMEKLLSLNTL